MIQFGTNKTKPLVREMWQTVFEDSNEFTDIYFSQKYKNENTLIYFEDGKPAASLQMWEYNFSFYGEQIPIYYLAGLATYEAYRRKGYMTELITYAHQVMKERDICLSILIPAEEWLYTFYKQFGYTQVFEKDDKEIPLKNILEKHNSLEKSFDTFDRIYNKTDFTVLKDFDQFKTIVEEQQVTDFEPKTNLDGIARIINLNKLLKIYAKHNSGKRFTVKVTGDSHIKENNSYFTIEEGTVSSFVYAITDFSVDIMDICELLLGHHNEMFSSKIIAKFPKHHPTMNLMLE